MKTKFIENNINESRDLEQVVLGSLLVDSDCFKLHYETLGSNLFVDSKNILVYEIICDQWQNSQSIDPVIIQEKLRFKGFPELTEYIDKLASKARSAKNVGHYISSLTELAVRRDFIVRFRNLIHLAEDNQTELLQIREKSFDSFNDLFVDRLLENQRQNRRFSELIEEVQRRFEHIAMGELSGIQSSLSIFNKAFGGWQNSDLVIVAGRPGMGKTALMVQAIIDTTTQGIPAGVFSLEMSSEQITARIVANYTEIPNSSILRKGLKDDEVQTYLNQKHSMVQLPIHIDDTPNISLQDLRLRAKLMKMRYDIKILFVDYIQLIVNYSKNNSNREQEIASISRGLKAVAKELNIPVIALSQLSRRVEQRLDKRPLLSDLRDSGSIEQDADEVVFLFRPEYYGIESWGAEYSHENTENQAEIIIQKNRHGGILSERVLTNMPTSKFIDL